MFLSRGTKKHILVFVLQFPMTYSCGTSTTELDNKELNLGEQLNNLKKTSKCCCKLIRMCNKSTCMQDEPLGAREQLKQKKLNNSLEYII